VSADPAQTTEQVLVEEREAVIARLAELEGRVPLEERVYERVLRLRRIAAKLENRIRLIRDLDRVRSRPAEA
jgi:hypothetical protein